MKILIQFVVFFSLTFVAAVPDFAQDGMQQNTPTNTASKSTASNNALLAVDEPIIEVTDFDFADVLVNAIRTGNIEIRNIGTATLVVTGFVVEGDAAITTEGSGWNFFSHLQLKPGESKRLEVSFSPTSEASYQSRIIFFSNAQTVDSIALITGRGYNPLTVLEQDGMTTIEAYPNPVSEFVSIRSSLFTTSTYTVTVTITNAIGSEVLRQNFNVANNEVKIPTGNFPHGVYLCTVTSGSKNLGTVKFVR